MDAPMAKPLGLTQRGGAWQLRIVVPADLQAHYGRKDFRISLGRGERAQVQARAHQLRAEREAEFASVRKSINAQPLDKVTPELASAFAQGVTAKVLAQDDEAREGAEMRHVLRELVAVIDAPRARLQIPTGAPEVPQQASPFEGLSDREAEVMAGLNAAAEGQAATALARRELSAVLPLADQVARSMGLAVNWKAPDGIAALRECLGAMRNAYRDRVKRDEGEFIPTPAAPSGAPVVPAAQAHTLDDVFPLWKAERKPAPGTAKKMGYSMRLFDGCLPGRYIESLTKADATAFIAHLRKGCAADKTAKDHFDNIKSLLNFAKVHLDWLQSNPWEGRKVEVKQSNTRELWQGDDLVKLFKSPLFTSYRLPAMKAAGGDAAYWVPLLGLYTGARAGELCQLRLVDIAEDEGGLSLHIVRDAGDAEEGTPGTSVKNASTQRRIPVHPELVRLGFADYVAARRRAGDALLFPAVERAPGRSAAEYFSDWFAVYRGEQGVKRDYLDFHSLRHTVRTRLVDAGVDDVVADRLTGHTIHGSTGAKRYTRFGLPLLREALSKLAYPELQLKRVYG
jgi:integrase